MNIGWKLGLVACLSTCVVLGDVDLFMPVSERARRADVIAVVAISQTTTSNCHARVSRVLKGKCPNELTLPIGSQYRNPCGSYGLAYYPTNVVVFLKQDESRLNLLELAPPLDSLAASFGQDLKVVETTIQLTPTNTPNTAPKAAPSPRR